MRGSANEAFVEGSDQDATFDWKLGATEHCDDCIELADLSPYTADTIISYPGDGGSVCLGNCGCTLVRDDGVEGFGHHSRGDDESEEAESPDAQTESSGGGSNPPTVPPTARGASDDGGHGESEDDGRTDREQLYGEAGAKLLTEYTSFGEEAYKSAVSEGESWAAGESPDSDWQAVFEATQRKLEELDFDEVTAYRGFHEPKTLNLARRYQTLSRAILLKAGAALHRFLIGRTLRSILPTRI